VGGAFVDIASAAASAAIASAAASAVIAAAAASAVGAVIAGFVRRHRGDAFGRRRDGCCGGKP